MLVAFVTLWMWRGSAGPSPARTTQREERGYRTAPALDAPPNSQPQQPPEPIPATLPGETARTAITTPPQKIISGQTGWLGRENCKNNPHPITESVCVCTEERECEEGAEREWDRQRGGKKGGGSPSSEKHHSISLTPQELSKEQDDVWQHAVPLQLLQLWWGWLSYL